MRKSEGREVETRVGESEEVQRMVSKVVRVD